MSFSRVSTLAQSLRITTRPSAMRARGLTERLHTGLVLTGLVLTAGLASSGCSEAPATGQCSSLLDHLVELEVNGGPAEENERKAHKIKLAEETRDAFVKRCNTDLKASQVSCGLKAKNTKELDSCDI